MFKMSFTSTLISRLISQVLDTDRQEQSTNALKKLVDLFLSTENKEELLEAGKALFALWLYSSVGSFVAPECHDPLYWRAFSERRRCPEAIKDYFRFLISPELTKETLQSFVLQHGFAIPERRLVPYNINYYLKGLAKAAHNVLFGKIGDQFTY